MSDKRGRLQCSAHGQVIYDLMQAAMFAMLAAFGAEVSTRTPVFVQIQKAPLAIAATFVILMAASVSPVLQTAFRHLNCHYYYPSMTNVKVVILC